MQQLHLMGFTSDGENLILSDRKSSKASTYLVALDDALRAAVNGSDPFGGATGEDDGAAGSLPRRRRPRPESNLSPREMQARLRAGQSVAEVAAEAGVEESWVERFANPVLAEQAQVIGQALRLTYFKPRRGPSDLPLRGSVRSNLIEKGVSLTEEEFDSGWSAWQMGGPVWAIGFSYRSRGRPQEAKWVIDLRAGSLVARNRLASALGYLDMKELPADAGPEDHSAAAESPAPATRRQARTTATSRTPAAPAARMPAPARTPAPARRPATTRAPAAPPASAPAPAKTPARALPANARLVTRPPARGGPVNRAPVKASPVTRGATKARAAAPARGQAKRPSASPRTARRASARRSQDKAGPEKPDVSPAEATPAEVPAGQSPSQVAAEVSPAEGAAAEVPGATSPGATPAGATPAGATPAGATPAGATPAEAVTPELGADTGPATDSPAEGTSPAIQLPEGDAAALTGQAVRVIPPDRPMPASETPPPVSATPGQDQAARPGPMPPPAEEPAGQEEVRPARAFSPARPPAPSAPAPGDPGPPSSASASPAGRPSRVPPAREPITGEDYSTKVLPARIQPRAQPAGAQPAGAQPGRTDRAARAAGPMRTGPPQTRAGRLTPRAGGDAPPARPPTRRGGGESSGGQAPRQEARRASRVRPLVAPSRTRQGRGQSPQEGDRDADLAPDSEADLPAVRILAPQAGSGAPGKWVPSSPSPPPAPAGEGFEEPDRGQPEQPPDEGGPRLLRRLRRR